LASVTSNFRPAAQLFVTSAWFVTVILKSASYLLFEHDEIWELVDPRFSTKSLPQPIITGNSLEVRKVFSLSYTMLFAQYREQANSETNDHASSANCYCGNKANVTWNRASRAQKQTLLLRVLYNVKSLTQLGYFS
jgi:hypothetical protein